ncbi:uncharacterized protein BXZ73DRAFT_80803 [Epithele typhae]|uniref:uncharacterized protein n=1 Tax=Epithele typhae TaxID=378194 RepID=UPI0020080E7C|nr:uncharacterized protein BXZ73DRAFT_80803 [Epithele typhae]KAH9917684.1 hypothetical protein BXZ73DRAFT_80803 [Epithele typhae]
MRHASTNCKGIDISHWQGTVDFDALRANGVSFVYIKATEGTTSIDPKFNSHYTGATRAGLVRGAYHFARPDKSSGAMQARHFLAHGGGWTSDGMTFLVRSTSNSQRPCSCWTFEDAPKGDRNYGLNASAMVSWIKDFSDTYQSAVGVYPGEHRELCAGIGRLTFDPVIYTTTDWWKTCTGNNASFASTNPLWIARYSSSIGMVPAGWSDVTIWQYADSGENVGCQDEYNGSERGLKKCRCFSFAGNASCADEPPPPPVTAMATSLFWPGKYYCYPIGNTSAVDLTRDISPEGDASILLLPCGDPRNILFSICSQDSAFPRKLHFTCVDYDACILARNVLLFAMLVDETPHHIVWNTFFHVYLDKKSHAALVTTCKKILAHSGGMQDWATSPYASCIQIASEHTLAQLRRQWSSFATLHDEKGSQAYRTLEFAVSDRRKEVLKDFGQSLHWSSTRSIGALLMKNIHAVELYSKVFKLYWQTGTTLTRTSDVNAATILNPTFCFSRAGRGFDLHYGTNPITPFHLAPLFGDARNNLAVKDLIDAASSQFSQWCQAYRVAVSGPSKARPVVRMWVGDALSVAQELLFAGHHTTSSQAPTRFDVIDTSNLSDHVGLTNMLLSAAALRTHSPSCVVYTESLLTYQQDSTTEFKEQIFADLTTVALLLDIAPIEAISGFTTRSNTHELMMHATFVDSDSKQFHQNVTWKRPRPRDISMERILPPATTTFTPFDLVSLLLNIYSRLYAGENPLHLLSQNLTRAKEQMRRDSYIVPSRQSFVILLCAVQRRLRPSQEHWDEVMKSLTQESSRRNERASVTLDDSSPIVRIYLKVPRAPLEALHGPGVPLTPYLHCSIRIGMYECIFQAVAAVFGDMQSQGTTSNPALNVNEDYHGLKGSSPFIVSFTASTHLITTAAQPEDVFVRLSVRATPVSTMVFARRLGLELKLFEASFEDAQITVENPRSKTAFTGGAVPEVAQHSACLLQLSIGNQTQAVAYPLPVLGAMHKLRLARKSGYVEIVVPVSVPCSTLEVMRFNPSPIVKSDTNSFHPWNIHRVTLEKLPLLKLPSKGPPLDWFNNHVCSAFSLRERANRDAKNHADVLMCVKDTIHALMARSVGLFGAPSRVFSLRDEPTGDSDTILFIHGIRLDLSSHTLVADASVLPLTPTVLDKLGPVFPKLIQGIEQTRVYGAEMRAWKQLLPALAERCRTWTHRPACEYRAAGRIPLTVELSEGDPLCACGRGHDAEPMRAVPAWRPFAPYVTRIALSPLFAVSYLEPVIDLAPVRDQIAAASKSTAPPPAPLWTVLPGLNHSDWRTMRELRETRDGERAVAEVLAVQERGVLLRDVSEATLEDSQIVMQGVVLMVPILLEESALALSLT